MDHLDEVAARRSGRNADSPVRRCRPSFSRPGVRGISPDAGREGLEDRIEVFHGASFAANHHAVAALQPPDAAAGPDVHIVDRSSAAVPWPGGYRPRNRNCRRRSGCRPLRDGAGGRRWSDPRQPPGPSARWRAASPACSQSPDRRRTAGAPSPAPARSTALGDMSKTTHWWPAFQKPAHHVCSHPSQTNHSELHSAFSLLELYKLARFRLLVLPVAADQVVRRTVMSPAPARLAFELRNNALRQHLAQFHAPLVERIDLPDGALR